MIGTVHSKAVKIWWKICPALVGRQRLQTEVNIAKVKEAVTENRHLTLRKLAAQLSVSQESIHTILNDCLGKKHVAARPVPKDLNFFQKLNHVNQRISLNNHRIHLIWLRSTVFSFQNSNYHFEAPVFSR